LPKVMISGLLGFVVLMGGCTRSNIRPSLRQNFQSPRSSPKMLAVYMPWFGDPSHMDVGYSSHDVNTLRKQVDQARTMGISGFVVDWYGNHRPYIDKTFDLLQRVAREKNFQVALMFDEAAGESGDITDDVLAALNHAYDAYIGPDAPNRDAYLTYQGRPVIFIFPKKADVDWNRVRSQLNGWSSPPLLIYKDNPPPGYAGAFDGYYPWVHPGHGGWAADGSDWGEQYLDNFYSTIKSKYPDKIVVGAVWPGFDDSHAKWGLNRHMDSRCGKTFEDTLQVSRNYYGDAAPLPFLLVETWNDYEEGTAVERPASRDCPAPSGS
jgi:hypothetical protein